MTTYSRIKHAAHYQGMTGAGHDLEMWTVQAATIAQAREIAQGMPPDAEYHTGHRVDSVQHWNFVRKAPLSEGTCKHCQS